LADPRVDSNKPRNDQATPLWFASQNGHLCDCAAPVGLRKGD